MPSPLSYALQEAVFLELPECCEYVFEGWREQVARDFERAGSARSAAFAAEVFDDAIAELVMFNSVLSHGDSPPASAMGPWLHV